MIRNLRTCQLSQNALLITNHYSTWKSCHLVICVCLHPLQVVCPDRFCGLLGRKRLEWGLVVVHVQRKVKSSLVAVLDVLGQALVMVYLLLNARVEPFKLAVGLRVIWS